MKITKEQAKQIVDFFPTIPYVINVFDTHILYDDENNVAIIEFLFQSANMNDDDTIKEYMAKTLGISEDDFEIQWDWLNGNVWMYICIMFDEFYFKN